jgi:hypothetical protein
MLLSEKPQRSCSFNWDLAPDYRGAFRRSIPSAHSWAEPDLIGGQVLGRLKQTAEAALLLQKTVNPFVAVFYHFVLRFVTTKGSQNDRK